MLLTDEAYSRAMGGESDLEICHLWCCDPTVALCGEDLTDQEEAEDDSEDEECPTCVIVDDVLACGLCGSRWIESEERYSDE